MSAHTPPRTKIYRNVGGLVVPRIKAMPWPTEIAYYKLGYFRGRHVGSILLKYIRARKDVEGLWDFAWWVYQEVNFLPRITQIALIFLFFRVNSRNLS